MRSTTSSEWSFSGDLSNGLDLALIGKFTLFGPDAVVTSDVITVRKVSRDAAGRVGSMGSLETAYIMFLAC